MVILPTRAVAEIMDMVAIDAEALDCANEVRHAQETLARGTSAQTQVRIYDQALAAGKDKQTALNKVVDWLIAETVRGL